MYPYAVVFSMIFSTSLIMAGAMGIAWSSFGRPVHAITWALAFGINSLQILCNAAAILTGRPPVLMAVTIVLTLVPCTLIAIGARQRAGLPDRFGWFVATFAAALALTQAVAIAVPGQVHLGIPSFFTSAALVVSVAAIVPRGRRPVPAEWALIGVDSAFALIQLAVAILAVLHHGDPADLRLARLHGSVLGIGLPAAFIGSGIVRVLLIASDLAGQLRYLARCDPLTGLFNRRGFEDGARAAIARAGGRGAPVTLAMADLDHFKAINDRFGHARGDDVLVWFARQLDRALGPSAVIGRLGGEEFGVLLAEPVAAATATLDRLRRRIGDASAAESGVDVSISIGAAEIRMVAGDPAAALVRGLAAADAALYRAKGEGRDRLSIDGVRPATPPVPPPAARSARGMASS